MFYLQVSTESIKDSPEDKPPVESADVVPPVEVDGDNIENLDDKDDDIDEIFDNEDEDEEEEEDEEEGEELESEDEEVIVPKKPEDKSVKNDVPAAKPSIPANKTEDTKVVPEVLPKPKDEIKKPEPPKTPETVEKEKPKANVDDVKKTEAPAKLKPEFETGEREGAAPKAPVSQKDSSKSEFEIVEREDKDEPPTKPKAELENVERGTAAMKPVQPPPPPPTSAKGDPATGPEPLKNVPATVTEPVKGLPATGPEPVKGVPATGPEPVKGVPKPEAPVKAAAHVKFEEDDDDDEETSGKGRVSAVADFAALEKGEKVAGPPGTTTGAATTAGDSVGDFLSAEQSHGQLLNRHQESIQDQQL